LEIPQTARDLAATPPVSGSQDLNLRPLAEGDHVVAEFWVTATNQGEKASIAGCLIAQLDASDGRCTHFREYWFDIDGHVDAFDGWGA
jgi:hypothetical protein